MEDRRKDICCQFCGHERAHHIYHEGACRPGFVCQSGCEEFVPPRSPDRVMVLPRKIADAEVGERWLTT